MFRSTDSGQNWQQINNGLLALYESALLIANGYIFVGADFVGGAGGVYRSTDYGDSWVEINHDMIQTDVRALATNPSDHIFAGTYFGGGVFRSTDNGNSSIDISGAVIPPGGNVWPLAIDSGWCALLELLVAAYFAARSTTARHSET